MKQAKRATLPASIEEEGTDILAAAAAATSPEGPASATSLRALLERLAAARAAALAKIDELEAFEAANVLEESDEVLDANAQTIVSTRRRVVRLEKWAERVEALLAEAAAREAEDDRRVRYAAAAALAREAEAWVRETYASCAAAIGAGLARLDEIAIDLEAANAELPEGASRLEIEDFRALPALPGTVSYEPQIFYVDDDGREVTPTIEEPLGIDPTGKLFLGAGVSKCRVHERIRDVPSRAPGRPRVAPRPLAAAVHLPGVLYGETDFWPRRSKLWDAT